MNETERRHRAADEARDAFLRAAAVLAEPGRLSTESITSALLNGALGMLNAAKADHESESALAASIGLLKKIQGKR